MPSHDSSRNCIRQRCLHGPLALLIVVLSLVACANSRDTSPLPGDSVSTDGAVRLSPPRFSSAPHEAREALGAIEQRLFPPELIMEHQSEIAITPAQKDAILKEVNQGQSEMLHLQWELQGEKEKLVKALDPVHVDEAKAAEAARRVMERETKVKSSHLAMLIRVKNLLTPQQQKLLTDLRAANVPTPRVSDAGVDAR